MSSSWSSTDPSEADRTALRAILAEIESGINERNLDRILQHLSDDAVVTYQNADVSRGEAEISALLGRSNRPSTRTAGAVITRRRMLLSSSCGISR